MVLRLSTIADERRQTGWVVRRRRAIRDGGGAARNAYTKKQDRARVTRQRGQQAQSLTYRVPSEMSLTYDRKDQAGLVLLPFIGFLHARNNLHDLGRNQKAELKGGASMYNTIWARTPWSTQSGLRALAI